MDEIKSLGCCDTDLCNVDGLNTISSGYEMKSSLAIFFLLTGALFF